MLQDAVVQLRPFPMVSLACSGGFMVVPERLVTG